MKIGWILTGSRSVAGARIHGWNMHERLLKRGYDSSIIYAPNGFTTNLTLAKEEIDAMPQFDIIFIQKLYGGDNLRYLLSKMTAKIVYICMDKINEVLSLKADHIIAVSDNLIAKLPQEKTTYIFDGYEQNMSLQKKHSVDKKISLVYLSNNVYDQFPQIDSLPENVLLKIIGPPLKRVLRFHPESKIFSATKYPFEYIEWKETTVTDEILKADVAIIPYPDELLSTTPILNKSNNRLIYFMSLGLPVIVSPLHEFEKLISHKKDGFVAKTKDEWQSYIVQLRNSPSLRKSVGQDARQRVLGYSADAQADEYESIISKLSKK